MTVEMDVTVVDDERDLAEVRSAWDELACATSRPYCSPAWMLSWWRHARPSGAALRAIVARDGPRFVGIAPFFAQRTRTGITRYRVLGARCSAHVDLLARPGEEEAMARAVAACLDRIRPRPNSILFDGVRESSPWPRLLSRNWTGGPPPRVVTEFGVPAPFVVTDDGGFDVWLAAKSRNFRQSLRRKRRGLEGLGATFGRVGVDDDLERALDDFAGLHRLRWDERGGSRVLTPGVERMLLDAGRELLPLGRFHLWRLEVDGCCISSHLFLSAGGETTYWLGGFDPTWGRYQPAMLSLLDAIEDAFGAGHERVDLGTGAQGYKLRFTDDVQQVCWVNVVPSGPIAPLVRLDLLPTRARLAAAEHLSPRAKERIRHAATRVRALVPTSEGPAHVRQQESERWS